MHSTMSRIALVDLGAQAQLMESPHLCLIFAAMVGPTSQPSQVNIIIDSMNALPASQLAQSCWYWTQGRSYLRLALTIFVCQNEATA